MLYEEYSLMAIVLTHAVNKVLLFLKKKKNTVSTEPLVDQGAMAPTTSLYISTFK